MELLLLFTMVIGLMLIGVPIAVSLGLSSILFLLIFSDSSLASVAQTLFEAFEGHSTLLAIPFFILASSFMSTGGVAKRIIRFSIALVGHFRGGLAIAGVLACMIFAALSGAVWFFGLMFITQSLTRSKQFSKVEKGRQICSSVCRQHARFGDFLLLGQIGRKL